MFFLLFLLCQLKYFDGTRPDLNCLNCQMKENGILFPDNYFDGNWYLDYKDVIDVSSSWCACPSCKFTRRSRHAMVVKFTHVFQSLSKSCLAQILWSRDKVKLLPKNWQSVPSCQCFQCSKVIVCCSSQITACSYLNFIN